MIGTSLRTILRMEKVARPLITGSPRLFSKYSGNARPKTLHCAKRSEIVLKLFPKTYQRDKFGNAILLSGILTFLGLKKEGEEESELLLTIKKGILSTQRGDPIKAERILHHALKLAHDESNEEGITYINDLLANIALDTGQYEKAEKLMINVMQRLISSGYEKTDLAVLHLSLKLAKVYEQMNNYEKSEIGYMFCKTNMEEKVKITEQNSEKYDDTMKLWITILDNYARFLVKQNKLKEAIDNFNEAHKVSIQVNGKDHENTAYLLNDLGSVFSLIGDLNSAVNCLQEAADIASDLSDFEDLSTIYLNLGLLYIAQEMYSEARSSCMKSLRRARIDDDNNAIENAQGCLKTIDLALKGDKN